MTIRSFVLRGGRLTDGQQRALDEIYPRLGISGPGSVLNYPALFGRQAPTILEIGFGNGESTWRMAQNEPDTDFIAVEVHAPGVGRLLMALDEHEITNCRVYRGDAVPFVRDSIPPASLAGVRIYFPDPWHKKRHHKRRLIQPEFVKLLAARLQTGGVLHVATDWEPYAEHIMEVLEASPHFDNATGPGAYTPHPAWRPATKYEARGDRLGHQSRDLVFTRNGDPVNGTG